MNHHTELLNYIAKKINAYSYLEIGVFNPDHNYNKIKVPFKASVDPDPKAKATLCMTSDQFFKEVNETGCDLIWIDGLHHADQVKKDIINSWHCLSVGGVIALHDCNPHSKALTCVPRGSQREWTGDVYKTICSIESEKFTIDMDYGICVLRKTNANSKIRIGDPYVISWDLFQMENKDLLNLVPVDEALKIIDAWQ